jgi:hypothetical protein
VEGKAERDSLVRKNKETMKKHSRRSGPAVTLSGVGEGEPVLYYTEQCRRIITPVLIKTLHSASVISFFPQIEKSCKEPLQVFQMMFGEEATSRRKVFRKRRWNKNGC